MSGVGVRRLTVGAFTLAAALYAGHVAGAVAHAPASSVCQEDQSCWDCAAMGNHVCGDGQYGELVEYLPAGSSVRDGWRCVRNGVRYVCHEVSR